MMTIKHISLGGRETIYPAFSVEFRPKGWVPNDEVTAADQPAPPSRVLGFTEDRFVVCEIQDGTVFVMNEFGKTVSRYDLGASMIPERVDVHTSSRHTN